MQQKQKSSKQATRGLKQILEENQSTITFYFYVVASSNLLYLLLRYLLFWESFTMKYFILYKLTAIAQLISFYYMKKISTPILDENGAIIDPGSDLNMEGHISEYFKDIILFPCFIYILTLFTNYAWLLLLLGPIYGFYKLWVKFLGPWFFAPAPENDQQEQDQKKNKEKRKIVRVR